MLASLSIYSPCTFRSFFGFVFILSVTGCSIFHAPERKPSAATSTVLTREYERAEIILCARCTNVS